MKGMKTAFAVLCLSTVFASHAHAQTAIGAEISQNTFGIYGTYGIYVANYNPDNYNLVPTTATGSGFNNSFAGGSYGNYSVALNESFAGPATGFAESGYGFEQFFTLGNDNPTGGLAYWSVYSFLRQEQIVTAGGTAVDYGGIVIAGPGYAYSIGYTPSAWSETGLPVTLPTTGPSSVTTTRRATPTRSLMVASRVPSLPASSSPSASGLAASLPPAPRPSPHRLPLRRSPSASSVPCDAETRRAKSSGIECSRGRFGGLLFLRPNPVNLLDIVSGHAISH
jgi:hypothetical protein